MKRLANDLNAMGFKLGIYSDAGGITCGGNDGSLGHEETDAKTFADWGVEYLKYDNCCIPQTKTDEDSHKYCPSVKPKITPNKHCTSSTGPCHCAPTGYDWKKSNSYKRYNDMSLALQKHAPQILFSMSIWGTADVTSWGREVGTSWRVWRDMLDNWPRFLEVVYGCSHVLDSTHFNGHNDADLMQLGNGDFKDLDKARSHFAPWAAMKSPLLLATDIPRLVAEHPEIITVIKNPYLHAFNQDEHYGEPAKPFNCTDKQKTPQYWAGPMSYQGEKGTLILMLNTQKETERMSFSRSQAGLTGAAYQSIDIWDGTKIDCSTASQFHKSVRGSDTAGMFVTPCTPPVSLSGGDL